MIWQGRNGEKVLKLRVIGRLGYAARQLRRKITARI